MSTDPPPAQRGLGEVTSHSAPSVPKAGGATEVSTAGVNSSVVEENMEDRGRQTSPGQDERAPEHPASSAPMTLKSPGRPGTPPAPLTGDDARRMS